ncbi:type II toxin-antitoxin system antitoxin DNA ADP-ribosyl glycohydrolase DarG [Nocardia cyriacigeorgica]|uniref:type II toxin-antitoxin system antitoxin DNA ADP-ribosyl glycohydrolase DarG n=1 Tax=Nocardia cyriacigeorgica TaxID=135487 RepID=UPI0024572A29|nr:macro domain-containing protein [Nocardia cyriacigeorgica]
MIREEHGNLLRAETDALVNTVNTVGVMGKGIALQFRRAYPEMFLAYEKAAKTGGIQVGRIFVWETGALSGPRFILNFPTKRHWRSGSRLPDIEAGLEDLVEVIRKFGIESIAIPPLGCGNGGLSWQDVAPRIWDALEPLAPDVDILVYPPEGAPPAAEMITRTPPPPMTTARATVIKLIAEYEHAVMHAPTQVEVHKLVYFLQYAGQALRLDFVKGRYGPYADNLRKTLREIEGHFITGFGDGSARALEAEPIRVIPDAAVRSDAVLADDPDSARRVEQVITLAEGFGSMYGMELLASVHWAAVVGKSRDGDEIAEYVQAWTERKGVLFSDSHVEAAVKRLAEQGWLPRGFVTNRP